MNKISYSGRSGHGYGNQRRGAGRRGGRGFSKRDVKLAQAAFQNRSVQSQKTDLSREAPLAPNLEIWLSAPQNWDAPGVDQKLSMDSKNRKLQSLMIAKAASRRKINLEIKALNEKKPTKRYRIVKNEAKELEKVENEAAKNLEAEIKQSPKIEEAKTDEYGRVLKPSMPTAQEIRELAVELYKKDQSVNPGIYETAPEPELTELREGGFLRQAQKQLMTSINNPAVSEYIESLKVDLESNGYTIVPL